MKIRGNKMPQIDLVEFTKEKEEQYRNVLPYLVEELDNYEKETGKEELLRYLLLSVDGEERIVQFISNCLVVYSIKGNNIFVKYLELDENYNVIKAGYEKYDAYREGDSMLFVDKETGLLQDFDYTLNGFTDEEGYNASAMYTQYDGTTDNKLYLVYPLIDREDGRMYSFHLNDPQRIIFVDKASKKIGKTINFRRERAYAKYVFDANNLYYDLVTAREHGFFKTLNEGAMSLQQDYSVTRYFRMTGANGDKIKINFTFGEYLTPEALKDEMDKHKYRLDVPDYIIDVYNCVDTEFFIDSCIGVVIGEIDKGYRRETGRSLVYLNEGNKK